MQLSLILASAFALANYSTATVLLGVNHAVRTPDRDPTVCSALASGSKKTNCNFEWAVYNACNCYFAGDKQYTCENYFKVVADACNNGTAALFITSEEDICKVGSDGSKFKECDYDWGMFNACECHYQGPNKYSFCLKSKDGTDECENKCKADGNCTTHC